MRSYVPQCIIEQEHARSSLVAARNGSLDWMSSMQVPCSRSFTDAPSRLHHHCATPSPGQSSSTPSKPQSTSGSSSAPDAELLVSLTDISGRAVPILGADDAPLEGRDPGPILAGHATASLDLSAARSPFHPRLHTPASPPYSWTLNQEDLTILHGGECDTRLNVLGRGPWGPVYRGLMHGTDPVAIRKLSLTAAGGVQMVGVTDILDQMHRLRHPCLVMFLGAAFIGDEVWVVAEMVDGHTVAAAQRQEGKGPLRWSPCMCRAALACARAINYLHRQRPPVVHGNICAESLILDDGSRSGRATSPSRCQDTNAANVGAKLVGWKIMALDKFTDASEEESGLLSVQPAASHAPEFAPGEHLHPSIDIFCLGRLLLYMAGGDAAPRSVSHLAAQCMSSSPCERPCAAQVVRELEEMLQKMTDGVVDS
uniref:Protein kinase domain-containing protein n=1 Tax=Tetraselmis chuii TaxID=63592 RepID=A0A7S1SL46_9CHLO|mmetsp:Transcript_17103/g.30567  ORF Transcript_17103/g.30567 Transcript_17103/m.30567 type:complete len:426 (+) Transcript_17103:205-1482(+)